MTVHPELAVDSAVFDWSVRLFTLLRRALGVNLKLHAARGDVAAGDIFLFNHFAPFETFIPQYLIHLETGDRCRAVASSELFRDEDEGFSTYLRDVGAVPADLPDLLPFLAAEVLRGRKIVMFPEDGVAREQRMLDVHGRHGGGSHPAHERRTQHTAAAVLALGLDAFKLAVRAAAARGDAHSVAAWARELALADGEALLAAARRPTVVVPANLTFYPVRVSDNLLRRGAQLLARGPSRRISEGLLVEGNIALKNTDMDLRLGAPVHPGEHWQWWERRLFARALAGDVAFAGFFDPRTVRGRPAVHVMARRIRHHALAVRDDYMRGIHEAVSVNLSQLASCLMLRLVEAGHKELSQASFRRMLYLAVKRVQRIDGVFLHRSLKNPWAYAGLPDGHCRALDQLLATAGSCGLIADGRDEQGAATLRFLPELRAEHGFDRVRLENPIEVYTNEVAPFAPVVDAVAGAIAGARETDARTLAALRFDDERVAWAWDGEHVAKPRKPGIPVPETATESGEPFLLLPERALPFGVLLVHGFLASPAELRGFGHRLAAMGFPVMGVRLKGHGTSPWDLRERSWQDWLASVARGHAIMAGHVRRIALVGFSTGGALCLRFAADAPPGVECVVSVCAPLKFRNRNLVFVPIVHGANRLVRWVSSLEGIMPFRPNQSDHPHINYHHIPVRALYELRRLVDEMQDRLPDVRCDALVVQADEDPVVDPRSAALIERRLGSARKRIAMVHASRHGILNEDLAGTQALVAEYLRGFAGDGDGAAAPRHV